MHDILVTRGCDDTLLRFDTYHDTWVPIRYISRFVLRILILLVLRFDIAVAILIFVFNSRTMEKKLNDNTNMTDCYNKKTHLRQSFVLFYFSFQYT